MNPSHILDLVEPILGLDQLFLDIDRSLHRVFDLPVDLDRLAHHVLDTVPILFDPLDPLVHNLDHVDHLDHHLVHLVILDLVVHLVVLDLVVHLVVLDLVETDGAEKIRFVPILILDKRWP